MSDEAAEAPEPSAPITLTETKLLLSRPEVERLVGLSTASIYRMIRADPPEFPLPVKVRRVVRWRSDEIREWIDGLERATGDLPR